MSANILNEKQKKYYLMIHFENGEIIIMFVYILIKTMGNSTKPLDITDNKSVIAAIKGNDEQAFEEVYRYYFRGLCAFCSQYVSQHESEEIVQDTMMWLWENRSSLIAELTLKTLLFTIVKNKALNRITHHDVRRKVHQEIAEKYEQEFENPDTYLENELIRLYNKALGKLPAEFRESYELNRKYHLTHKDCRKVKSISPDYKLSDKSSLENLTYRTKRLLAIIITFIQFSTVKQMNTFIIVSFFQPTTDIDSDLFCHYLSKGFQG